MQGIDKILVMLEDFIDYIVVPVYLLNARLPPLHQKTHPGTPEHR